MTLQDAKADAQSAVQAARDELVDISLDIHAHPELAMEEKRASSSSPTGWRRAASPWSAAAFGLETAFRARWGEGPVTIAYLCEYDALPEIGHACGHNLIATAGLGGALGLKGAISPDDVTLLVLGTPGGGGHRRQGDHDRARRLRRRRRGDDGAPGAVRHRRPADVRRRVVRGHLHGPRRARLRRARDRHQRARRPCHRVPVGRAAPAAHPA